jgi:broad specificity phosphatase PhoE
MEKQFSDMNLNDNFLKLLEEQILASKVNNEKSIKSILLSLFTNDGVKKEFLTHLYKTLEKKTFYFIRHAQAEHNHYNLYGREQGIKEPDFYDPIITDEGISQCAKIEESLNKLDRVIQLVYVSPLRRTLQTYSLIEKTLNPKGVKVTVTDLLREKLKKPKSHRGHIVEKLIDEFKNDSLDFSYIRKKYWWTQFDDDEYDHEKHATEKEGSSNCEWRIALTLIWIILKEEKNVCIISHSGIYATILLKHESKHGPKCRHGGFYNIERKTIKLYLEVMLAKLFDK